MHKDRTNRGALLCVWSRVKKNTEAERVEEKEGGLEAVVLRGPCQEGPPGRWLKACSVQKDYSSRPSKPVPNKQIQSIRG